MAILISIKVVVVQFSPCWISLGYWCPLALDIGYLRL